MERSDVLFIINPISGGKTKKNLPSMIESCLDQNKFNARYVFTEYEGHASELAGGIDASEFDVIVAVGGDGTVNEVASEVIKRNKVLGIIPFGSGNGLSRYLKIPMSSSRAVQVLNERNIKAIDAGKIGDKYFFNMAGAGFDAHISAVFAKQKLRGLRGYLKLGFNEMINYRAEKYCFSVDSKNYSRRAFAISVANSSQYGNNAHIAPDASVTDGILDLCVIKEFPLYKLPLLAYQMLLRQTDRFGLVEIIRGKEINILRESDGFVHIDGEPYLMGKDVHISVLPQALKIIA
nr:diacylglycerol kinase family protein [Pedobacter sp. ELA7]